MPAESLAFRPRALALPSPAAVIAFAAGAASPFTIGVIGEEPMGELIFLATAVWALLCLALHHAWPGDLLAQKTCRRLLLAEGLALAAYIFSDLYRGSHPHDYFRGWARIAFLGIDIVGVAYLFGRSPRNFVTFMAGMCLGQAAQAELLAPLFGDLWKFGFAVPVSIAVLLTLPRLGALAASVAALALGIVNFASDYRSEGGICLLTAAFTLLQIVPRRGRHWLAPFLALAATVLVFTVYGRTEHETRADRSDIERQAMMQVAGEAFLRSPVIGHGSWFSNTPVYDEFVSLRAQLAREYHLPGFAPGNTDPGDIAFHSQILVALAEGGILGGAFFILYGFALIRAGYRLIFTERWSRYAPLALYLLISSAWDLVFSPFSGEQRITIAATCGLIFLLLRPGGLSGALISVRRP